MQLSQLKVLGEPREPFFKKVLWPPEAFVFLSLSETALRVAADVAAEAESAVPELGDVSPG